MIRFKPVCVIIYIALISATCTAAEESKIATGKNVIESIPYELTAEGEQLGSVKINNNAVEIVATKGTDLFTDTTGTKNEEKTPRLVFSPKGDFIFSAKVSAKFGNSPYEGGALIVYSESKSWGKLLFEKFKSGKIGVATTVSKGTGDDAYHGSRDTSFQYLKVVRHDSSYIFYTSQDGAEWNFVRHFELKADNPVRLGFIAQSPVGDSFSATFSEIKFRAGKITNFWQGE